MIGTFIELHEIQQVFNAAEEVLEEDIGRSVCLSRCGLCCMHNIPFWMTIEAINTVSVVSGTGRNKLDKLLSLTEGWLLERHAIAPTYEGVPIGFVPPKIRDEWLAMRLGQCPFLGLDRRCLIHNVRPLACQAYGVTRDISNCPRPPGRGETLTQRRYIPADLLRGKIESFRGRCKEKNPTWIHSGFAPTLLYRVARPEKFKQLVLDNKIASAKLVNVEFEINLMWQPQVDALRGGVSPDLVASLPRNREGTSIMVGGSR